MKTIKLFKKEPYPSFPEEWDNPENTVFREFYICSAADYEILYNLVKSQMSDRGNKGITRYRLMKILWASHLREFYLVHQRRKYPYTWLVRWKIRKLCEYIHRRFKTRKFRNAVELSRISIKIANEIINNQKQ